MATTNVGRFAWHELHTNDRAKAVKFYATLLHWETKDVSMGPGEPYGLCLLGGKDIAGITKSMAPANVPPHWLPYLAVEDVDATADKAAKLGGKVMSKPMDIPNVGRFAVVADPQGAVFALYKHAKPYEAEPERPPVSAFCWDELMTSDPEAASKFYGQLLGYAFDAQDMGPMGKYWVAKRGDRMTAGIMKTPPNVPAPPHWMTYVHVKNVDDATRNAKELGANVLMPPSDIPNMGRFSVIADPTGAAIGLFTGK